MYSEMVGKFRRVCSEKKRYISRSYTQWKKHNVGKYMALSLDEYVGLGVLHCCQKKFNVKFIFTITANVKGLPSGRKTRS